MDVIGVPPLNAELPVADVDGELTGDHAGWPSPWANFMTKAGMILFACSESGPTSGRPTTNLYAGRPYFDESLAATGRPIWVNKNLTGWVDSAGNAV